MFACVCIHGAVRPSGSARASDARAGAGDGALTHFAHGYSPRVETIREDLVIFDARGLGRLFGGPGTLASHIGEAAAEHGWHTGIALAHTRVAAVLIARAATGAQVVPAGREAQHVAALPLAGLVVADQIEWPLVPRCRAPASACASWRIGGAAGRLPCARCRGRAVARDPGPVGTRHHRRLRGAAARRHPQPSRGGGRAVAPTRARRGPAAAGARPRRGALRRVDGAGVAHRGARAVVLRAGAPARPVVPAPRSAASAGRSACVCGCASSPAPCTHAISSYQWPCAIQRSCARCCCSTWSRTRRRPASTR